MVEEKTMATPSFKKQLAKAVLARGEHLQATSSGLAACNFPAQTRPVHSPNRHVEGPGSISLMTSAPHPSLAFMEAAVRPMTGIARTNSGSPAA